MKPFEILTWSVVTLAVVFLVITIFNGLFIQDSLEEKLEQKLNEAKLPNFIGKTLPVGVIDLQQNQVLSKDSFDLIKMSLAIECNNEAYCCPIGEDCSKIIEWNYENLKSKRTLTTNAFVRCIQEQNLPVCKIYIGKYPAQIEIIQTTLTSQANNSSMFEVKVKNTGNVNLAFVTAGFELYKKVNNNFEKFDYDFVEQEIKILPVSTEHTFIWSINTNLPGEYQVKFLVSGENGGFDSNSINFNTYFNEECQINSNKIEEFELNDEELNNQNFYYKEYHYCNNCNAAWECLAVYKEKYPSTNFEIENKERVSCYSISVGSYCFEE